MDRKTKKKNAQKLLAVKSRHARFITEYIKRRTPDLYKEADEFFSILRAKHPEKRDLTKTHEFLVKTTCFSDYRDYYNRTKLRKYNKRSTTTTTTTTTSTTCVEDNMELNVVLLPQHVVKENATTPLQPMQDDVFQGLLEEISADPSLQSIFNDMSSPQDNDIIRDPEQEEIFNSLQQTPLEKELTLMGYN